MPCMHDDLRWFIAIAETQNLTAAADRVHSSQPTLSRFLGRLERDLGVALFDRDGRRLVLNRFGRAYLDRARRAASQLEAGRRELDDMRAPARGAVRLAFLHSFGLGLVPELISGFRSENPEARFTLTQDAAATVVGHVVDGEADLAIVAPRPMRTDMAWARVAEQKLAREHRFAGRDQIGIVESADEEFIVMQHGYGMRRIFDEICAANDLTPSIAFESSELATVSGLVAAGLGVGVVPVEESVRHPGVELIPLAGESREIGLTWFRGRPLSDVASRFRDFVVARSTDVR